MRSVASTVWTSVAMLARDGNPPSPHCCVLDSGPTETWIITLPRSLKVANKRRCTPVERYRPSETVIAGLTFTSASRRTLPPELRLLCHVTEWMPSTSRIHCSICSWRAAGTAVSTSSFRLSEQSSQPILAIMSATNMAAVASIHK